MSRAVPILLVAVVVLSACGLDGAPTRPTSDPEPAPQPGITVSGSGYSGVAARL
ncbi:hypothetical protein G5B39_00085 [Rhodobacteraceae bacterium SC52]|nr:hypothetical protein G5B39_00085 [Rhodobacteraceae bacterium SC52]